MTGFTCEVCGEYHEGLPMDIEHKYPAEYFTVPPEERAKRVFFSPDYCVIDERVFVIRGVLPLPIKGSDQEFRWGTWAIAGEEDFKRYLELWDSPDADQEPPFLGKLTGGVYNYSDSDLLPVAVHLRSGNLRPIFKVISDEHPLGVDQREGVTMEYVHDLFTRIQEANSEKERKAVKENKENQGE
jgi:hypothetical protein